MTNKKLRALMEGFAKKEGIHLRDLKDKFFSADRKQKQNLIKLPLNQ